jgi:2-iminobutanoate/2-iminopropanoate deaminase
MTTERRAVATPHAAAPVGPYSQGIVSGGFLFVSGQGPHNAAGELVGATFAEHVVGALDNIAAIATAAGTDIKNMVRLGAYLEDDDNFAEYNDVLRSYFVEPYPARTTIPVPLLGIPIELDAVIAIDTP